MHKIALNVLVAAVVCAGAAQVAAAASDETAESAVWLLKKATLVHRDGMHNVLLRSLRQLDDPSLKPLFSDLVQKRHPVLKIHGILALGEIDEKNQIDLALIAEIKDAATQAQLVSSAIEGELLSVDQAKQLIEWPGLDVAVKVIVATKLVHAKQLTNTAVLDEGLKDDNLALKSMSALLKLETGDQSAMKHLDQLSLSEKSNRDTVRAMLLQTAMRYEFSAVAPWAIKMSAEPAVEQNLSYLALRTAMRFAAPGAAEAWERRFASTTNPADRLRLAVLALDLAPHLQPATFDALQNDPDEVVRQMGEVGKLMASKQAPAVTHDPTLKLLEMNNLLTSKWVLQHALEQPIDAARPLLVGLIFQAEGGGNPDRFRGQRLENAVLATQQMAEKDPTAAGLLPGVMGQVPALSQEAMLVGLIRSKVKDVNPLIAGVKWANETAESLALLLRIKHGHKPTAEETARLALIVRGGAGLQDPLRIQAAWMYLKLTQQDRFALASVLGQP